TRRHRFYDKERVLPRAGGVNLLRIQHERPRKEYFPGVGEETRLVGLTKKRGKMVKPGCFVMHPGPVNRRIEVDSEVADGNQSVILDQVTNGLAVRMAVLYLCGGIATWERWQSHVWVEHSFRVLVIAVCDHELLHLGNNQTCRQERTKIGRRG